jgi:protein SCO1/2
MKTAILVFVALLAGTVHAAEGKLKAGVFDPPRVAPDFSLKGSDGGELRLSRYRGKVVALGFGFSSCPEICPTTLATLARAQKKLGESGKDFQVVYVTVDPERDSPERLRTYLTAFNPGFIGGSGTPQQLTRVHQAYGIVAEKNNHSSFVYLIDREGRLRAMVPYGRSADDIAHDVAILLKK